MDAEGFPASWSGCYKGLGSVVRFEIPVMFDWMSRKKRVGGVATRTRPARPAMDDDAANRQ